MIDQLKRCERLKKGGSEKRGKEVGVNDLALKEGTGFGNWRALCNEMDQEETRTTPSSPAWVNERFCELLTDVNAKVQ